MRIRKKNQTTADEVEDDFDNYAHMKVVGFHPHCYVQPIALADAKLFDEYYAMAHNPVLGENEKED